MRSGSAQETARANLALFLEKLRHVKPAMGGRDLIEMGVPQGPAVGEMLTMLKRARLGGTAGSRAEEVDLVQEALKSEGAG